VQAGPPAEELGIEGDRLRDVLDREVPVDLERVALDEPDRGRLEPDDRILLVRKKSPLFRWPSRISLPVVTEAVASSTTIFESSGRSAISMVPS
jgi:hypothetical protein